MRADLLTLLLILTADRITKVIVPLLMDLHQSIPVIPGFFHITYVRNTGVAFGILAGWESPLKRGFFILASVVALILLWILYKQAVSSSLRSLRLALVLITAGAVGNLFDRAMTGEVVDFLDFFIGRHHWPAFNAADSAITVGAVFLAFLYLTGRAELQRDQE
jgi:signal peptidase II